MDIVLANLLVVICSKAREYNNLSEASLCLTYSRAAEVLMQKKSGGAALRAVTVTA